MAGHSKWNNIRIKKGRVDAKRGKLFTKLARDILVAGKDGSDPESNFRLKIAIVKAKKENLPAANIERLLKKLAGGDTGDGMDEVTYEGYGPGGVAILVEALTDNRNRTAAEVRLAFNKKLGSIGEAGCVAWLFDRRGKLSIPRKTVSEEDLFLAATEAGALDVGEDDEEEYFAVLTEPNELHQVRVGLEQSGIKAEDVQFVMIPRTRVETSAEDAIACLRLIEALEDQDDVQRVTSNIELTDELLKEIEDQV
jgi:YebC/PmpR family DNA-binding regulatory protein